MPRAYVVLELDATNGTKERYEADLDFVYAEPGQLLDSVVKKVKDAAGIQKG